MVEGVDCLHFNLFNMENKDLIKFINEIFAKRGVPPVKNICNDFSDGSKTLQPSMTFLILLSLVLFEKLFNILYDEKVDCKLIKSPLMDVKVQNWNKINASICFNYLQ